MNKRRFEYRVGRSSKFWEVETRGDEMTTFWGRIGQPPTQKTKKFTSRYSADTMAYDLIRTKLRKGYTEIKMAEPKITPPVVNQGPTYTSAIQSSALNPTLPTGPMVVPGRSIAPAQSNRRPMCTKCAKNPVSSAPGSTLCATCIKPPKEEPNTQTSSSHMDRFQLIEMD